MGKTLYRQAMEKAVEENIKENKEWVTLLYDISIKMEKGFYKDLDTLGQLFHDSFDLVDAYAFMCVWGRIYTGEILTAKIHVGNGPYMNSQIEGNNILLSDLPKPFVAEFWGGLELSDGLLRWEKQIQVGQIIGDGTEKRETIAASVAPLEVGLTKFENSYYHLWQQRSLARWPYDDEFITLFVVVDDKFISVPDVPYTPLKNRNRQLQLW